MVAGKSFRPHNGGRKLFWNNEDIRAARIEPQPAHTQHVVGSAVLGLTSVHILTPYKTLLVGKGFIFSRILKILLTASGR